MNHPSRRYPLVKSDTSFCVKKNITGGSRVSDMISGEKEIAGGVSGSRRHQIKGEYGICYSAAISLFKRKEDQQLVCLKILRLLHNLFVTMTDRNITLIKDLDNMKDDYTLKVSIIRLWRSISDVNPIIVKSIEMILMDEMCTKIRASVYPRDFQRYSFKISDVKDKLNLHGFSCVSFETIISATTTSNDLIDVIGEVVSLGKLDSRDVNKSRHKLPLQIRNLEGLQVNVTLFEDIAYQLISYVEAHKQVGRLPSDNSHFDHTRMFINADLPDIVTFTDSLVGLRGLQNPSSSLTVDTSQSYSEYDDFLINHNVKNVVDLLEPQEVGKFIIVGTIYGIRQDIDWYYDACTNRGKKVDARNVFSGPESGDASVVYECYSDKCIKKEISSVPRYKAGNSANADDTKIASHELKSLKDAISQTGDNLTPSMPDKFEATSPFKFNLPPMVKKRNVGDSIDVDEYDNVNSSTKVPRLNSKVDGNTVLVFMVFNIDSSWFIFAAILCLN
ncbi:unnamed protein product [Lactuca virosa]|uniref:Replication protein A 70 kDa DNA-binding subunit B/D first OB fold domain-containing protein n=1 Tax=Lactuca virosa TaxID=75947 RepID=A0AAU9NUQ9_9ASTR|nr:unnamed protein product [Lactuca virosa]